VKNKGCSTILGAALAVGTLLCGIFLLWFGATKFMTALGLGQDIVKTTGTIVDVYEDGEGYHTATVQFAGEDDQQHVAYMSCAPIDCFSESSIGSSVPVIYSRNRPELGVPDTFLGRWVTTLCLVLIALGLTLAGAAGAVGFIDDLSRRIARKDE
jgi:hypothetical protein